LVTVTPEGPTTPNLLSSMAKSVYSGTRSGRRSQSGTGVFVARAKVVGIFPNSDSLLRLFTAVLQDQHDEWQDGRRHFSQQSMARVMHPDGPPLLTNPLTD
jgi:hypothetical protein